MNTTQSPIAPLPAPRAPYRAPHLTVHGSIQRLTLGPGGSVAGSGGTGGIPDSGMNPNEGGLNG